MAHGLPLLSQSTCGSKWNSLISSLLPMQAEVPQGSVLGPVHFLVVTNDLSDSLKNPFSLFADDSTLCCTISHPSDQQVAASSLSADLNKVTSWSNTWNMSFNPDKSHSHDVSPKGPSGTPPPPNLLSQQSL